MRGNACDQKDFKKGSRGLKKGCRFSHDTETLEVIEGVGSIEEDVERAVIGPFDLRSITTKRYARIAFIVVDGVLIFDHKRDSVWLESEFSRSKSRSSSLVDVPPAASVSTNIGEGEGEEAFDSGSVQKCAPSLEEASANAATDMSAALLLKALKREIDRVSMFLEDHEMARVREVSKDVKAYVASSSMIRSRLREAQNLMAGVLAKRKKSEKKKKQKMTKTQDKKDGFARGGASGN